MGIRGEKGGGGGGGGDFFFFCLKRDYQRCFNYLFDYMFRCYFVGGSTSFPMVGPLFAIILELRVI